MLSWRGGRFASAVIRRTPNDLGSARAYSSLFYNVLRVDILRDQSPLVHVSDVLASANAPNENLLCQFARAACYSAIQEPLLGVTQLLDHIPGVKLEGSVKFIEEPAAAPFGSRTWHAQTVGSALGKLLPFLATAVCVKGAMHRLEAEAALLSKQSSIGLSLREAACTGFVADALFKPTAKQDDWVYQRLGNGSVGAVTFSAMTAGSLGLDQLAKAKTVSKIGVSAVLSNPIFSGIVSALPAGLAGAEFEALQSHGRLATRREVLQSMYSTAVIGGVLGPVNHYGGKVSAKLFAANGRAREAPKSVCGEPEALNPSRSLSATGETGALVPATGRAPFAVQPACISASAGRVEPMQLKPAEGKTARIDMSTLTEVQQIVTGKEWSQLRTDQQQVITAAIDTVFIRVKESGLDAPAFFARDFDTREFLRARNHLIKHCEAQEGVSVASLDHSAAALTAMFGKSWKTWLDRMESVGVERMDAASCLPLRSREQRVGLAELLLENATPARTSERNLDQSDVVSLVTTVASKWQNAKPEYLNLPLDELAFRLTEGMSRAEFRPRRDSLSQTRLTPRSADAQGVASGEFVVFTENTSNAGSLCFQCEGPRAHISLLAVEPAYRRLGYGQLLIREVEFQVSPRANEITLDVAAKNTPAVNLYTATGFVPDARLFNNPSVLSLSMAIASSPPR